MMKRVYFLFLALLVMLTACTSPAVDEPSTPTSTVEIMDPQPDSSPTPTSVPPVSFTICTAGLPDGLFPYDGIQTGIKDDLLSMVYEQAFDRIDGDLAPVLLKEVPSRANGSLRLEPVAVRRGQAIVDAWGELSILQAGTRVRLSGCRAPDCAVDWDGETTIEMDRMVVDFYLREDLAWSDGAGVTAADSVFSFELASAPEAPGLKWVETRTEAYRALDPLTVQWHGIPGFTTGDIERLFWQPLPAHAFGGSESWAALAEAALLKSTPLSYGPYLVDSYTPEFIRFVANPQYSRLDEGMRLLDEVTFLAIDGRPAEAWEMLQAGKCDLLDASLGLENAPELLAAIEEEPGFQVKLQPGTAWMQLVFGIQPGSFNERPNYFSDPRTRQAVAACLDREGMLGNWGTPWASFLPKDVSQLNQEYRLTYNPALAMEILDQVGWRDYDSNPETSLQAWGVADIPLGTPFSVELLITPAGFHRELAESIGQSLNNCGIDLQVREHPAQDLFAAGPDGPLFGRQFDLALVAWQPLPVEDCGYYLSWQIPSGDNRWVGTNLAGLDERAYDQACTTAALALPDEKPGALALAEYAFIVALPAVPLDAPPRVVAFREGSCLAEVVPDGTDSFSTWLRIGENEHCH